jgi:hypothetical protein
MQGRAVFVQDFVSASLPLVRFQVSGVWNRLDHAVVSYEEFRVRVDRKSIK